MEVRQVRVRSFSREALHVSWELGDYFPAPNVTLTAEVLRSRNPNDEYESITAVIPVMQDSFLDTTVGRVGLHRDFFYRVRLLDQDGNVVAVSHTVGGAALEAEPTLPALEIARTTQITLRSHVGRKLLLFQKRQHGARCVQCFNRVTMQRTRSNCNACFDTGYSGGFYRPIVVYGVIEEPRRVTMKDASGKVPVRQAMMRFGHFPLLREGDLIVEAENKRWLVGANINAVSLRRFVVRQEVTLVQLDSSNVEFKVPVNVDADDWFGSNEHMLNGAKDLSEAEGMSKGLSAVFDKRYVP